MTGAYGLPARRVVHAVGPVWNGGASGERELLASCYRRSLDLAVEYGARSIAFPAISCGVYRFPVQLAAEIAINVVARYLASNETIERVLMVCFDPEVFDCYSRRYRGDAVGG